MIDHTVQHALLLHVLPMLSNHMSCIYMYIYTTNSHKDILKVYITYLCLCVLALMMDSSCTRAIIL